MTVGDVFSFVTQKNKDKSVTNVITNSAEWGLIPQREFFEKDVASKDNTDVYTVIQKGDFVYNPRKSSTAPFGPFNCYKLTERGIVSPLYTCLRKRSNDVSSDYLEWYFASKAWHRYIYNNGAQGGARHDRVGMTNDLMKGIPISVPCLEEQNKIASTISSVDDLITTLAEEVRLWEEKKKGVMQKIFSQEVRFKDENGEDYPDWEEKPLSYYLYEKSEKNKLNLYGKNDVLSVSKDKGVVNQIEHLGKSMAGDDLTNYKCVSTGDIIYTKSPLGEQPYGIIKDSQMEGIVSVLYAVYKCTEYADPIFISQYFSNTTILNNYLKPLVNIGAKHTMNVSNSAAISGLVTFPSKEEQTKIVDCLSSIDEVITIKKQKLETWKTIKKGLLQQMFV